MNFRCSLGAARLAIAAAAPHAILDNRPADGRPAIFTGLLNRQGQSPVGTEGHSNENYASGHEQERNTGKIRLGAGFRDLSNHVSSPPPSLLPREIGRTAPGLVAAILRCNLTKNQVKRWASIEVAECAPSLSAVDCRASATERNSKSRLREFFVTVSSNR